MLNKKALAASVSAPPAEYVEDVFSTYLYTGNGSTQSITNGIDLAGKGGLVWGKNRDSGTSDHYLADTAQGTGKFLSSNSIYETTSSATSLTAFNSNGFSIGNAGAFINNNNVKYASWTFRKAKKFFDVVTYTGNGSSSQTIAHNLGSQPGFIMLKQTSATSDWQVFARKDATNYSFVQLNLTGAQLGDVAQSDLATSSVVKVGWLRDVWLDFNTNGETYVAYVFAHDAGGFGAAGTDNIISCGSYTGTGATGNVVTLGYEPQYVLIKDTTSTNSWYVFDTIRGMSITGGSFLYPNLSNAEVVATSPRITPTATGFSVDSTSTAFNASGNTYIYMAIRRPMKTPTSGTEVFSTVARTGTSATATVSAGFPVDLSITRYRDAGGAGWTFDRLRGPTKYIVTNETSAEATDAASLIGFDSNSGVRFGADGTNSFVNYSPNTYANWFFRRATGFFDIVCYTGNATNRTITHNLGVAPELMIVKRRSTSGTSWFTYSSATGNTNALLLDTTDAAFSATAWNNTTPTSSVFSLGTSAGVNGSGSTYVAYLFATVAGVSKVGSYTGDGTDGRVINCGFTGGARFVLIKSTSNTGHWRVWDTARGIVSGNDPALRLNTTDAETTNSDDLDPTSSGFIINSSGLSAINESGWEYIYLAIA